MAHDRATRRAALGRLILGESAHRVSRDLGLPRSTVRRWQRELWATSAENGPQKKEGADRGAAVGDWLAESLTTGSVLLAELRDPARLRQMNARELAIMHGRLFDDGWRLLAGLRVAPTRGAMGESHLDIAGDSGAQ